MNHKSFSSASAPVVIFLFILSGCANFTDIPKQMWGSSTKALEDARADATTQVYNCQVDECFYRILAFSAKKEYEVFIQNKRKRIIVVMGVPGSVDTTEVGIFFAPSISGTTIEITSLSSNAKRTVANALSAWWNGDDEDVDQAGKSGNPDQAGDEDGDIE